MSVVYKYTLDAFEASTQFGQTIEMPENTDILLAGVQELTPRQIQLWGHVHDAEAPTVSRTFIMVGTGHERDDLETHVGSFQHGSFVWHIFERGN